jgi:Zn-finger nucleic acid-binding protein
MKCTSCKQGDLHPNFIDDLFRAHTCNHCGGNWILIEDYVTWSENHPEHEFKSVEISQIDNSTKALICPMSGTIMQKIQINKDSDHKLDYSARVGGVWLDKGEWELLKSSQLAGSLNAILTDHYQQQIRDAKAADHFSALYQSKFGSDDYQKAKELREWLTNHENKADLRSYLLAADPYSARR